MKDVTGVNVFLYPSPTPLLENNIYKQNYKLVHKSNSFSVVLINCYSEN